MDLEPPQAPEIFGPLLIENLLTDAPVFGPNRVNVEAVKHQAAELSSACSDLVIDELAEQAAAPLDVNNSLTVAEKLNALRLYKQECTARSQSQGQNGKSQVMSENHDVPHVQRDRHEKLLNEKMDSRGLPSQGHAVLDHIMLLRAKEKYLFHAITNQKVVAEDPWLQDVWAWVAGKSTIWN